MKTLKLNKEVISTLGLSKVEGGCPQHTPPGPTNSALFTCPPSGWQCF